MQWHVVVLTLLIHTPYNLIKRESSNTTGLKSRRTKAKKKTEITNTHLHTPTHAPKPPSNTQFHKQNTTRNFHQKIILTETMTPFLITKVCPQKDVKALISCRTQFRRCHVTWPQHVLVTPRDVCVAAADRRSTAAK